ncbi:hypothetical protein CSUI_011344, partial [Cystoisospora suis]
ILGVSRSCLFSHLLEDRKGRREIEAGVLMVLFISIVEGSVCVNTASLRCSSAIKSKEKER